MYAVSFACAVESTDVALFLVVNAFAFVVSAVVNVVYALASALDALFFAVVALSNVDFVVVTAFSASFFAPALLSAYASHTRHGSGTSQHPKKQIC